MTPGTGKRGKAIKSAMNIFTNDKATSVREKELMRCMKEQDLAKNLPAKVKISVPNVHKHK